MHKDLYRNIDSLFESWEMRILTALMANGAVSNKKAIDPTILPEGYGKNIRGLVPKGYVIPIDRRVYLTMRGKLIANRGMRELVDNDMWPQDME